MLFLSSTSDVISITIDDDITVDVHAAFIDISGGVGTSDRQNTALDTTGTVTVVSSPGSGVRRAIKSIHVRNTDVSAVNVVVEHTDGVTAVELYSASLGAGETLVFEDHSGWDKYDSTGIRYGPLGFTGSRGFTGEGFTGSRGFTGSLGFTGSRGFTGSQGDQGIQGDAGATGFTGSQGNTGDTGATGFTGSQGNAGTTGFTGSQGNTGDTGATGFTGSQGNAGTTGFTGSQGNAGTTGFTGSQGNAGTTGFTGSQGYTGSGGTVLPTALGTDQTYEGITIQRIAGETVVFGNLVFPNPDGRVYLCDNTAVESFPCIGMVVVGGNENDTVTVLMFGIVRNDAWNWTVGGDTPILVGDGVPTQTVPTGTDEVIQIVGWAHPNADTIIIKPSTDFVVLE